MLAKTRERFHHGSSISPAAMIAARPRGKE
jgi:hypothetical protein